MRHVVIRFLDWLEELRNWAAKPSRRAGSSASRSRRRTRLDMQVLETRLAMTTTYTVTSNSDSALVAGSLGYEIAAAVAADETSAVINFDSSLASETIQLGSGDASAAANTAGYGPTAYLINGTSGTNITIDGAAAPGLTIDGGSAVRLFAVTSGDTLTLANLTLADGLSQGTNGAGGNGDTGGGGGGGAGLGGAVFNDGGTFAADNCTFTNNTAHGGNGGAGWNSGVGAGGGLVSSDGGQFGQGGAAGAGFDAGSGGGFGGGGGGGGFSGNGGAGGFGGGGGGGGSSDFLLLGDGQGGIGGFGGAWGASGFDGGGGGGGAGLGGAIFNNQGTLTLTNDTFTANSAIGGSGGGTASAGTGDGGAVFDRNGTLNATFDTFTGNTAAAGGTDVYVLKDTGNGGDNTSPASGTASATLVNDILGQSTATVSDFVDNNGVTLTGSENDLVSDNPGTGGLTGTNIITGNPYLGSLATNGGPTETIALEAVSPALSAGVAADYPGTSTPITTDQRGVARASTPDIGAYELTSALTAPTVAVTEAGGTYNGSAFTATATVNSGTSLEGVTPTLTYYSGASTTGTALSGAPSTVGTYTVLASFAGSTDYTSGAASATFSITQAAPTVTVTDDGGVVTGSAYTATTTSIESVTPTLTYYSGSGTTGTALSGAPTHGGTYTVLASFAGSTDYTSGEASASFSITQAVPTVTVTDNGGTYNGAAFTATAGDGEDVSEGPTLTYYSGSSTTGTALSGAPSAVGTYTVVASYAANSDYTSGAASTTFVISPAATTPVLAVGGPAVDYLPKVGAIDILPSATLSTGNGAFANAALSVVETAAATYPYDRLGIGSGGGLVVSGSTLVYDSVTIGTFTGGGNAALTIHFNANATQAAVLAVVQNVMFNNVNPDMPTLSNRSVVFQLTDGLGHAGTAVTQTVVVTDRATPTVRVTDGGGIYGNGSFAATATVAGVGSQSAPAATLDGLAPTLAYYSGTAATGSALSGAPTAVGTYTVLASFAGRADYTSAAASATFTITKAAPSVTDAGGSYTGSAFAANPVSLEGVSLTFTYHSGTSTTGSALSGAPTLVGTYTVLASFAGSSDYAAGTASTTFTIGKATPTVGVTDASGVYSGSAFAATDTVAGVGSQSTPAASLEGVSPTLTYYTGTAATGTPLSGAPTAAGTYTVLASFAGSADYTSGAASTTFLIAPVATPPAISIGATVSYVPKSAAIDVAPAATLSTGSGAFANASLSVVEAAAATYPYDRLGIGSGGGLVVSGSSLIYGSVAIGTFTGGGNSPLAIHFNANATQAAVLAVVHNVTFVNVNTSAMTIANRTVTFQLTDGLGHASAAVSQTIVLTAPGT